MAHVKRFEDLKIWQIARELCNKVYALINSGKCGKDFDLILQTRRSSGTCMDCIAEGFGRGGNREFVQFLSIVTGSANEVKSQLYRSLDQKYITKADKTAEKLYNKTGAFIRYLLRSDIKGEKFGAYDKTVAGKKG